ncbi:MAG: segregation/condensation protein A [Acidobacteria bacterium]|nr:segregation/condensation protein A [Acidobacteriota bacterium]
MSEPPQFDDPAAGEVGFDPEALSTHKAPLQLTLPQFEGPLDLLLHLVRSNDMDILDIPIVEVAQQYNAYLDQMRELDLDVASEYLLMAATLAHIKSRMMLPPDPLDEQAEDPRAELARQLVEYEKFRKAAEELAALESRRDLVFSRPGPPPPDLAGCETVRADLSDLVRAFERVLRRLEAGERVEAIRREDFAIEDMMRRILDRLAAGVSLSFHELLAGCRLRLERIAMFLALLELVRLRYIEAWQAVARGEITLERRPGVPDTIDAETLAAALAPPSPVISQHTDTPQ